MSTYKELDVLAQVTKQTGYLSSVEKRDVLRYYEIHECGLNQLVAMVNWNRDMNNHQPVIIVSMYRMLTNSKGANK